MGKTHSFFKRNGILLVFVSLMLVTLMGQAYTGRHESNAERMEKNLPQYSFIQYLGSGHFIQATFENWESEFLQMGLFVILTAFLYQQGSAESKNLDEPEAVEREPKAHSRAPWPVKKGGFYLCVYNYSLSLSFIVLFMVSILFHAYGTMKDMIENGEPITIWQVLLENRFWFESLQNWQSEFLSIAAIVFLSIYLRQKGSPESKPVDAPHDETGK